MKFYLLLATVVVAIACVWGLTTRNNTTHQMVDRSQSVNAIIDEAAR